MHVIPRGRDCSWHLNMRKQKHKEVTSLAQVGPVVMTELRCSPGVLRSLQPALQGEQQDGHLRLNLHSAPGVPPHSGHSSCGTFTCAHQEESGKTKIKVQTVIPNSNHGGCSSHSPGARQPPLDPNSSDPRILS